MACNKKGVGMKRYARDIRRVLIALCIITVIIMVKKVYASIFTFDHYVCSFHYVLSPKAQQDIINFIHNSDTRQKDTPQQLFTGLSKQFPFVTSLKACYRVPGIIHLDMRNVDLMATINQKYVIAEDGRIFSKEYFSSHYVASLPNITVRDMDVNDTHLSSALQKFVRYFPSALYEQFLITWVHETEIWLENKQQQNFAFLCSTERIPDKRLLECSEIIQKNAVQKEMFKKKSVRLIADIRFDNQIIVFPGKRGYYNG